MNNIFDLTDTLTSKEEFSERIVSTETFVLERIVSRGHSTPAGTWYNQQRDEWVVLLQGEALLSFEDGAQKHFVQGTCVFIPAHYKHRVEHTSSNPPCVWLALHANMRGGIETLSNS